MTTEDYFEKIYVLLIIFITGVVVGWSFIFIFLKQMGYSISEILAFFAVVYFTYLLLSVIVRQLNANRSIKISLIVRAAAFLLLIAFFSRLQIYLAAICVGIITLIYWIPFNIKTQNATKKSESAYKSGLISIIAPMLTGVFAIAGAGFVEHFGYSMLFIAGAFIMALAYFYVDRTGPTFEIKLSVREGVRSLGKTKPLFFLEGLWQGLIWFAIPVITLFFTESVIIFGAFLAYLSIFSIAAILLAARTSDKMENRRVFIIPIFLVTAGFIIVSYFTNDIVMWTFVNAGISFFSAMMAPFMGAVLKDKVEDTHNGVFGREILLNVGRLSACGVMAVAILLGDFKASLIIAGASLILYMVAVIRRRIY